MTKVLFTEKNAGLSFQIRSINEDVKSEINKSGMMILRNVPCTILDEKNANGRSYSTGTMNSAIKENQKKGLYESRSLACTADDHPETTYPKPINSSHVVLDSKIIESGGKQVLLNDWLILNTRTGKDFRALIEGGMTVGTSIRGLGRQNESTGEIEDYEYLGTDVVGNPSAGTFASFKELNESILIESVPETLVESINESMNNNNKSDEEEKEMFDLEEAISAFKSKHGEGDITPELVSDLIEIEKQVLEDPRDLGLFEGFKKEILGELPKKRDQISGDQSKQEEAKDEDVLNKTTRHLEASEIVSQQLKEQNEQLLEELKILRRYKESSAKLVNELTGRVKKALEDIKAREENIEDSENNIVQSMKDISVQITEDLQKEAKEAILNLESRLEHTIQLSNIVTKYFFASKAINESLMNRIKNQSRVKEETVNSLSESVNSKQKSKREPSRPGWK